MKMKMGMGIALFSIGIGISLSAAAQENFASVISAAGGVDKSTNFELEWTLGEVATETITSVNSLYTQGFHQPVLSAEKMMLKPGATTAIKHITIFPNPASGILNIQLGFSSDVPLFVILYDIYGQQLLEKENPAGSTLIQLNLSKYAHGTYLLKIRNLSGSDFSEYKIIKGQ